MRGEYRKSQVKANNTSELPPRARRIRAFSPNFPSSVGTTSACAENTLLETQPNRARRNYLRVRGEYRHPRFRETINLELPPRARRIPAVNRFCCSNKGTTSACAENTAYSEVQTAFAGNYLRVRGEYVPIDSTPSNNVELPPRARRILSPRSPVICFLGTTSACAENTGQAGDYASASRNYLRVRGEYGPTTPRTRHHLELPPRARRIHQ